MSTGTERLIIIINNIVVVVVIYETKVVLCVQVALAIVELTAMPNISDRE